MLLNRTQEVRLPPEKVEQLRLPSPTPAYDRSKARTASPPQGTAAPLDVALYTTLPAPRAHHVGSIAEAQAVDLLRASTQLGASSFGAQRRMVMGMKESIKAQRRQASREAGWTLDCVGSAKGDPMIRLPRYLPYYDSKQSLFLKAPERWAAPEGGAWAAVPARLDAAPPLTLPFLFAEGVPR